MGAWLQFFVTSPRCWPSDNCVCLHCGRETLVPRETMAELELRLDSASVIRMHRSAMVNVDRIRELQPWFRSD